VSGAAAGTEELLGVALECARASAEVLVPHFERVARSGDAPEDVGELDVSTKSTPTDLVSEADFEGERAIREVLRARRPDDAVLGEEEGEAAAQGEEATSGLRWLVDPLDGTVNFLFGIPHWCVSVACEDADGMLVGVIHDPLRGETFAAQRGGDATLNGERLRGSGRDQLATAMIATGFWYDAEVRARQAEIVARLIPLARDIRRLGSAALDLAWVAAGRYDGYYERGLAPWDLAAGSLLCECAGLVVEPLESDGGLPSGVVAGSRALVDELRPLVA
jgi:myo-inositol-1(or 4)-monophosphatase